MLYLVNKTVIIKKYYLTFSIILLFATSIISTPMLYSYSGSITQYDQIKLGETMQTSIALELLAADEIRTYETSYENPSIHNNFSLELRSLIIDGTELISSPVSGIAIFQQYMWSTFLSIDFEFDDLWLYAEQEVAGLLYNVNPVPLFEIRYKSHNSLSNGIVYFSTMKNVPEPGIFQLLGFGIMGIALLLYHRKRKL